MAVVRHSRWNPRWQCRVLEHVHAAGGWVRVGARRFEPADAVEMAQALIAAAKIAEAQRNLDARHLVRAAERMVA